MRLPDWLRNTVEGVRNLAAFGPVIWEFRSWDWEHNLAIFKRSLELTEETTRLHGDHEGAEREARTMRVAIHLMDRIIRNDYCKDEEQGLFDLIEVGTERWTVCLKTNTDDVLRTYKKRKQLAKNDWEYLWKLLNKHLKHWWS